MNGIDDVVDGEAELHGQVRFHDRVGGPGADQVDTDDLVGLVVFDDLDEAEQECETARTNWAGDR